jgi:hypothetical protein
LLDLVIRGAAVVARNAIVPMAGGPGQVLRRFDA